MSVPGSVSSGTYQVSPGLQVKHSVPNKKAEVDELKAQLRSPDNQRDGSKYLQAVQKVIAHMTIGIDVSKVFSDMIMAGATANLVQKKLVYHYICTYAHSHPDLAVLTINTLTKDACDHNPVVRGLALRSLCGLRIPALVDYIREPLKAGLQDRSPYVRRMAIMGCLKLYYYASELVHNLNLVDILYRMLRDKDPQVVVCCLATLNEILAAEGGVVVNRNITHYLLNRLKEFSEWGQCLVMDVLMRYAPEEEEEMVDMLNVLDDRLSHANSGVVMGAVRLFLHLTQDILHMQEDVYDRVKSPLLTFLGSDTPELVFVCLQHMQMLLAKNSSLFQKEFKSFFCRYNDPPYLKLKKIEILTEIVSAVTAKELVEELGEYSTDPNPLVSKSSIEALGSIALRQPEHAQTCVVKLLSLLTLEIKHITAEVLVAFTKTLRNYESMLEVILPCLPRNLEEGLSDKGRASYVWILGEFGDLIPGSPYILEGLARGVAEESPQLKLALLTAFVKLFLKHPAQCQESLGRLLEYAIEEETDMDVHDRGMLYYRLLKHDVEQARAVVCGGGAKLVIQENTVLPRFGLFPEFNTLSVMYQELSEGFVEQEAPFIVAKDRPTEAALKGELTFDAGRFVTDSVSSGSPPGTPTSQRKEELTQGVPIADLLGDIDFSVHASPVASKPPPSVLLKPDAALSPADFQDKWFKLRVSDEMKVELGAVPTPAEFTQTLRDKSIFTVASGPPHLEEIKFFVFAQQISTMQLFLVEADLAKTTHLLKVTLKCENPSQASDFLRHFREALVGKWIAQNPLDLA